MIPPRLLPVVLAVLVFGVSACGPAILDVAPPIVAPGEPIQIFGTGFSPTATASLRGPGVIQLQVISATSATIEARVPGAAPAGEYDVVVSSDGADATLAGGLTVVAGRTTIRFLDVGQGDGTLVTGPDGQSLLIDGGPESASDVVAEAVKAVGGVDHVALTHTDADHLAGLTALLAGDDGGAGTDDDLVPLTRWIGHDDVLCTSLLCNRFRNLRARFERPLVGDAVDLGGATVEVVGRDGDFGAAGSVAVADDENERSLALLVRFGGRTVFIGGDLTGGGLGSSDVEAAAARATGPVDVLRLNHHGSATSSSVGFLSALQPAAVVVSEGTDNPFCHPERGVVERLAEAGPTIFSTGRGIVNDGVRCDGATAWPTGSRVGLGTIELVIEEDGRLTIDGEPF
jgi:competence protein ComEC